MHFKHESILTNDVLTIIKRVNHIEFHVEFFYLRMHH